MMIDISTTYMGLHLPSPIIAASSGLTSKIGKLKELEDNGAGAVVLKSLFEEEIVVDLKRQKNKLQSESLLYPETMEYYEEVDVEDKLINYLKLIFEAKNQLQIPVIASINCVSPFNWPYFTKYLQESGADGIELNVFTLPADINQPGNYYEQNLVDIVAEVLKIATIPVAVKISPYYSGFSNMLNLLQEAGIKGVTMFNRFYSPDIDIEKITVSAGPTFSQPDEYVNSLRWIALTSSAIKCDMVASTGVHDGKTVAKMLLAGAAGVQVASALYKNGIAHLKTMNNELEAWMERKGLELIDQFQGKLAYKTEDENTVGFERVQFMRYFT